MKRKTVKKVEHKKAKKIEVKEPVKQTHEVLKEVQSEPALEAVEKFPDPPPEPVNLAASLPTHTPGLERC